MALRELASLEKYLGLKKPNKYSSRGDKKVTEHCIGMAFKSAPFFFWRGNILYAAERKLMLFS